MGEWEEHEMGRMEGRTSLKMYYVNILYTCRVHVCASTGVYTCRRKGSSS